MPKILDGTAIAAAIKREVAEEVKLLALCGIRPALAAVLVLREHASVSLTHSKWEESLC
jgi:5,10-methylene-tetrahydrofolate dehydrogenase/methenyl tetrahydrofolate cyclohydrolase